MEGTQSPHKRRRLSPSASPALLPKRVSSPVKRLSPSIPIVKQECHDGPMETVPSPITRPPTSEPTVNPSAAPSSTDSHMDDDDPLAEIDLSLLSHTPSVDTQTNLALFDPSSMILDFSTLDQSFLFDLPTEMESALAASTTPESTSSVGGGSAEISGSLDRFFRSGDSAGFLGGMASVGTTPLGSPDLKALAESLIQDSPVISPTEGSEGQGGTALKPKLTMLSLPSPSVPSVNVVRPSPAVPSPAAVSTPSALTSKSVPAPHPKPLAPKPTQTPPPILAPARAPPLISLPKPSQAASRPTPTPAPKPVKPKPVALSVPPPVHRTTSAPLPPTVKPEPIPSIPLDDISLDPNALPPELMSFDFAALEASVLAGMAAAEPSAGPSQPASTSTNARPSIVPNTHSLPLRTTSVAPPALAPIPTAIVPRPVSTQPPKTAAPPARSHTAPVPTLRTMNPAAYGRPPSQAVNLNTVLTGINSLLASPSAGSTTFSTVNPEMLTPASMWTAEDRKHYLSLLPSSSLVQIILKLTETSPGLLAYPRALNDVVLQLEVQALKPKLGPGQRVGLGGTPVRYAPPRPGMPVGSPAGAVRPALYHPPGVRPVVRPSTPVGVRPAMNTVRPALPGSLQARPLASPQPTGVRPRPPIARTSLGTPTHPPPPGLTGRPTGTLPKPSPSIHPATLAVRPKPVRPAQQGQPPPPPPVLQGGMAQGMAALISQLLPRGPSPSSPSPGVGAAAAAGQTGPASGGKASSPG